jgi:predicted acylesterase/phospholipase RssA
MDRTRYSLLTIDGGGIRGVIPARILQEIEQRLGRPVCELFDMVAGTSTGGIIAIGLTKPRDGTREPANSAADLLDLYINHGAELFPDSLLLKIRALGGLADVRYPTEPLEKLLKDRFEDAHLSDALTEVVIPTYDLSKPGPFFFKRSYTHDDPAYDVEMWQVARATSAAPTYFEPACVAEFKGEGEHALVDGGVYANNPSVAAYSDAVNLWGDSAEINVVSIGTGAPPETESQHGGIPVPYADARHWGLARWAHPMLEVVFDGIAKAVEYQMDRLCRTEGRLHYHRLQSTLPTANHALDDASPTNLKALRADAETLIRDEAATLNDICLMLGAVAAERDAARAAHV